MINNKAINKTHFQLLILSLILCLISLFYLSILVSNRQPLPIGSLWAASIFSITFGLAVILFVKLFLDLPIYSYPVLFILVTFLYTMSSFILFPLDGWDAFRGYKVVDPKGIELGLPIVLLAFASFFVGCAIPFLRFSYASNFVDEGYLNVVPNPSPLRAIALLIYCISVFLILYATLIGSGLSLSYVGGYRDFADTRKLGNLPYIISASYAWFLPWSSLILLGTMASKKQVIPTMLLIFTSIAILLFIGTRSTPTILLVLCVPVFYIRKLPFKWWQILLVFLVVVTIVSSWDAIRKLPISSWNISILVNEISNETLGEDVGETDYFQYKTPFGWILSNVANSYQTLMGAVRLVPEIESYRFGSDYLRSLLITVPFFPSSGLLNMVDQPTTWITERLYGGWAGLGFLQVGEAYINFSWLGVVFLYAALGLFLTQLWWKLTSNQVKDQFLSYSLIIMMGLLHWIRNDSSDMGRTLVWGYIIVYLIPWAHMKITRRMSLTEMNKNLLRS